MPRHARIKDLWKGKCKVCGARGGPIIKGSPNVYANNRKSARKFDTTICYNGHKGFIATGSPDVYTNDIPDARVTDAVSGNNKGIIVTGSHNVYDDEL